MNDDRLINTEKILLYTTDEGGVSIDVYFQDETFWMTQKIMAELFDVESNTITYHIQEIFSSNELNDIPTTRKIRVVQNEGDRRVTREVLYYNLDMIIAIGYRVNSKQATQFRRWATNTLREYIVKGFVLNEEMLKNGRPFGKDYFDELLERIREIRASERRFYQKITDIYALSYDYNKNSEITKMFFATVQNKLLFAITSYTSAEIIKERADNKKSHMGLPTWKNAPEGKILKSDVKISKNYLNEKELKALNNIVDMYLSYAENQASRGKLMSMADWAEKLDAFLKFNEYDILSNAGKISKELAEDLVSKEYEEFRKRQDMEYTSDFDKMTKKMVQNKGG